VSYRAPPVRGPLVVSFNGRIFGLDRDTGAIRWERELEPGAQAIRFQVVEDRIYTATSVHALCLDYQSGEEIWSVARRHYGTGMILVQGDRMFVATNGEVECISTDGELVWDNGFSGKGYGAIALGLPGVAVQEDVKR